MKKRRRAWAVEVTAHKCCKESRCVRLFVVVFALLEECLVDAFIRAGIIKSYRNCSVIITQKYKRCVLICRVNLTKNCSSLYEFDYAKAVDAKI